MMLLVENYAKLQVAESQSGMAHDLIIPNRHV